jgi:heme A synthase
LIAAGLLGASALIVAKKPNAASVINALVPFQALIGAGTLVLGVLELLRLGPKNLFDTIRWVPVMGGSFLGGILSGILLGFMFAIPLMARLGAGQQRAAEVAAKIAPWQLLIGCVAAVSGVLIILFRSGILPPTFPNGIF